MVEVGVIRRSRVKARMWAQRVIENQILAKPSQAKPSQARASATLSPD
jgi:hypothetical protein